MFHLERRENRESPKIGTLRGIASKKVEQLGLQLTDNKQLKFEDFSILEKWKRQKNSKENVDVATNEKPRMLYFTGFAKIQVKKMSTVRTVIY